VHQKEGVKVALTVLRDDPQTHEARKPRDLAEVDWDFGWRFERVFPLGPSSPLAIPELGLAYRIETTVAKVEGAPAEGKLQDNDVIQEVRFRVPTEEWGESKEGQWQELKSDQWAHVFYALQGMTYKDMSLRVKRNDKIEEVQLTAQPDPTWPLDELGVLLQTEKVIQKADSVLEAMAMGLDDTWQSLMQVYLVIRGMIFQRLSLKNLGGPITIGVIAYKVAQMDTWEFIFFLGLISINLAAFNFLPIPVLDGGHMVFLIYEKLRGKQASEAVQWGAVLGGLVLLGMLMLFVLWQDLVRWVFRL
jgi:regulator of sigma E protease